MLIRWSFSCSKWSSQFPSALPVCASSPCISVSSSKNFSSQLLISGHNTQWPYIILKPHIVVDMLETFPILSGWILWFKNKLQIWEIIPTANYQLVSIHHEIHLLSSSFHKDLNLAKDQEKMWCLLHKISIPHTMGPYAPNQGASRKLRVNSPRGSNLVRKKRVTSFMFYHLFHQKKRRIVACLPPNRKKTITVLRPSDFWVPILFSG